MQIMNDLLIKITSPAANEEAKFMLNKMRELGRSPVPVHASVSATRSS